MARLANPEKILAQLDEQQQQAVRALDGPVRIFAGAGTGKTRTITHRIAYGAALGAWSSREVLAVTFTSKAALEMRERLQSLGIDSPQVRTFHAQALLDLNTYWPEVCDTPIPELKTNLRPYLIQGVHTLQGQGYLKILRGQIFYAEEFFDELNPLQVQKAFQAGEDEQSIITPVVEAILDEIAWAKVSLIDQFRYVEAVQKLGRPVPFSLPPQVFGRIYQAFETAKVKNNVIDFNDLLLLASYMIVKHDSVRKKIHKRYRFITVDEYQDVSPIQQFLLNQWLGKNRNLCVVGDANQTIYSFAGATPRFLLDFKQKYPEAIDVSLAVNYRSVPAPVALANFLVQNNPGTINLTTRKKYGTSVKFEIFESDEAELEAIAQLIASFPDRDIPEVAILTRTNLSSGSVIAKLKEHGVKAYDRNQQFALKIDDAHIEPELQNNDDLSDDDNDNDELSIVGAEYLPFKLAEPTSQLPKKIERLLSPAKNPATHSVKPIEAKPPAGKPAGVSVLTIHAAKGLEFKIVFVVGVYEGNLPYMEAQTQGQLDEEKRLLYVAITRAKERLYISYARAKRSQNKRSRAKSQFLEGIWPAKSQS
ncbi:MAG: ATP-dependent helicase [Bifidobacteriaceae bacterium]|jgi:DNA helicase-2/ATP-dependent DNA helicase PcrA|nr:ATP-dependent helicase [Bifidobacteriaceae bacterium]